ncbi:hypothetical protein FOMPIDRAFT_93604 [Fomitopsis schrenkii]|uniref:Uncharacterized protein n=1 Tax=Fomitopsis schrenkii TaxID=2126942 RepID=S8EWM9_FOMSC|nr:hypothetical protein FOMPIDRAFT_93604 [Fomitopsis schrenkii]
MDGHDIGEAAHGWNAGGASRRNYRNFRKACRRARTSFESGEAKPVGRNVEWKEQRPTVGKPSAELGTPARGESDRQVKDEVVSKADCTSGAKSPMTTPMIIATGRIMGAESLSVRRRFLTSTTPARS